MFKPSARIAVAALAIPLFGGFATYAAAQVSTKPAPQVVIPGGPGTDNHGKPVTTASKRGHDVNDDRTSTTVTTVAGHNGPGHDGLGHDANDDNGVDPAGHDANDDKGVDPAGHDVNDDHGGATPTTVSDDPAGHDANDDKGVDPAGHDANDDKGDDNVTPTTIHTPTTATTPTTADDGHRGGGKSGDHGSDG